MSLPPGRLAGVDYGTVRVGVALTDARRTIASPYAEYRRRDPQADARYFSQLVRDESIAGFVVGLPLHLDGHESAKSIEAREFGKWLAAVTGVSVVFFDERFSTKEAEDLLSAAKLTKKKRKARLDMLAAQVMLAAYLDSDAAKTDAPRSLDD